MLVVLKLLFIANRVELVRTASQIALPCQVEFSHVPFSAAFATCCKLCQL
jgi:hypothetical protein